MALSILRWISLVSVLGRALGNPIVTDVQPRQMGFGGGAVTIHGQGFSEDVFSQFDPVLGNKVWFANEFVSVVCQTPINWNFLLENPQDPSTTKIVCDLPAREGMQGSDWFSLILKVDGVEVTNSKQIQYKNNYTPWIRSVTPRYGKPGDPITIGGRIFTKEYGNANFGDSGSVDDRREQSITAVMLGTRECELTDDLGNLYGLSLEDSDSNEGSLTCLPGGSFIGPVNGTVFVSDKYGKSQIKGAYSVNSKGQLFIYHMLPEITSVSPNVGGSAGGTHVTIQGNSFDAYPGMTTVNLGSTPCTIISITTGELVCSTSAEDELTGEGVGPRGLLYEIWTETEDATVDDTSASDYKSMTLDGSTVEGPYFNETNGFTARLSGYFVAPYSGNLTFKLKSSDEATLYLSTDADPANKMMIVDGDGSSDPVELVEGNLYYIEAVHVQSASASEENTLGISLWEHKTMWHNSQTDLAKDERQNLYFSYDRVFETQAITFQGMDGVDEITFTHHGKKAKSAVSPSSIGGWGDTFTNMLTYSCNYLNNNIKIKQDYEDTSFKLPGAGGNMQEAVQAYCGARAMENQERVLHTYSNNDKEIDAKKTPWFCFATMGSSYRGKVSLRVLWQDTNNDDRVNWIRLYNVWESSDEWSHHCIDMQETLMNPNVSSIADSLHSKSDLDIQDIFLHVGDITGNYYMDEITFSSSIVEIERKSPSLKNDNVMVNSVTVTEEKETGAYNVAITPWTCNPEEDDFDLFGVDGASIDGLDLSGMDGQEAYEAYQNYLATSESVTFTSDDWGGGTVTVERVSRGTRAITGTFSITYKDQIIDLPPYPTDKSLAPILESFGMVGVKTVYSGDKNKCYDTVLKIEFGSSWAGDVAPMIVDATNLIVENDGLTTDFRITTSTDGGLTISEPGGDFFRMPVSAPTMSVTVGGFMASCGAPDCTFTYDSALTPTLDSVTDAVVDGNVELTISGSGFTEDISDFVVTVGDLNCDVTVASSDSITCILEAGPAGIYEISVVVKSLGIANQPSAGTLTHEILMEIFSNDPTEGSLGGGTTITVTGSGFPASLEAWSGGSVSIGGTECKVISSSYSEFKCTTSAHDGGARHKRSAAELTITIGSTTVTGGSFNFDASLTPAVTSISPTSSSPLGGEVLTVTGTAFGAAWGQVLLGDAQCTTISWFPTEINCVLPPNTHGDYPVHVEVPGNGFADVTGVSTVSYDFVVTDMTPRKGSSLGGTRVKISGSGFRNCTDIEVNLGDVMTCDIIECSDTEIICKTKKNSVVHTVNNGGRHPVYGPGYVWNPIQVMIQPGDTVRWNWNLQVASEETGISVQQTSGPATDEYNGSGFKSEKSAKGGLLQVFDSPGTYYYSSQPVFGIELFMKGTVVVTGPSEDITTSLSVMMKDIPAAQQPVADTGSVDFGDCAVSADTTCVDDPSSDESFEFTLAVCLTPTVTSIDLTGGAQNFSALPLEGFNGAEITIVGSGFSENSCQNVITIGENGKCNVDSSSASEIVCTVDGSGTEPLESMKSGLININVLNSGSAILNVADPNTARFNLVPLVTGTNGDSGSWAGGNLYILSGSGLVPFGGQPTVFVTFGEAPYSMGCTTVDVAFDYISCIVPDFTGYKGGLASKTVPVTVNLGYDQVSPIQEMGNITYTYDDALTSSATAMTPSTISASESISIAGTNFGSSARVFLRGESTARMRLRRALPNREIVEEHSIKKREVHEFWTRFANTDSPNWRCLHGAVCNHDEISMMSEIPTRYKRETDPYADKYEDMAKEDDDALDYEVCRTDAQACSQRLNKADDDMSIGNRMKREANEAELLEMALLTEGTYEATVTEVTASSISFTPPALPAGDYEVIINVDGQGNAISTVGSLTSSMEITNVTPDMGSVYGGQLIDIVGSGFCTISGATTATIGGEDCVVTGDVMPDSITCVTPPGDEGAAEVEVTSCGVTATYNSYNYAMDSSPEITHPIDPESASGPATLQLEGLNFGSDPLVHVKPSTIKPSNHQMCLVTASTDTSITCDLPGLPGGDYDVTVHNSALGNSNAATFTSTLAISSITPASGSFGGGSPLIISGTGFDSDGNPDVTVCDSACQITTITTSQIECLTPANSATGSTEECDVVVSQSSGTVTEAAGFTYDQALTPSVDSISPVRGGTGGGTLITISGSGFADSGNTVMFDGSICDIASESGTEITCYTNSHNGAIETPVIVEVPDQGYAQYTDIAAATFYYIDRWSSIWTWGGTGTPLEGEFIVITEGQTILLDVSTPVLAFLLLKGGKLMFDGDAAEIELQSKYILLVEGGQLEIGTEDEPYPEESKAMITMHGNVRCTEMPIFGCKVIGVRNGTLDFHGAYVPVTWTHLAETAPAGATEITLKQPVTWKVGDHIILATTSDRSSMKENEEHYIEAISEDGYTITLVEPLKYQHISIEQTFGDSVVENRGEVAVLTRNILIKGTMNEQFVEVLPACEQEFSSGAAFSDGMQTCFAGKFGEELGSDEMGAIIIISPKYQDQGLVAARIEYTEFTNVGQAFRVGRYPIHFHIPGNVNTSYIRGNAIHHSNNRACTLHNVHNLVVERNVAYSIKGLSFFLEDGIEEHNTLQYNLAVFTRMSNSLLNPDINPASFWIVNPNNKFRHNACAGGTHFCFWLRPAKVPDGPSWTMNYCPNKVNLDEFHNNTAHSMGWYGFWIFGQSNHATYDPHTGDISNGYCHGQRTQARFGSFTTWNNKRGFEIVSGANIRLENQTHMDHDFAAYEIFTAKGPYGEDGPGIYNSLIVGHSEVSALTKPDTPCTPGGIHVTDGGYTIKDVAFYNFDRNCYCFGVKLSESSATTSAVRVEGLTFVDSPNKILNPLGEDQGLFFADVDGSLTGTEGANLVGHSPTNPPSCVKDETGELGEANMGGHPGSVCPGDVTFHRFIMTGKNSPSALKFNHITVTNDHGNSSRSWGMMTEGWQTLLVQEEGMVNWITFDHSEHVTNISYDASASDMHPDGGNFVLIGHKFYQTPDRFTVLNGQDAVNASEALTEMPTYEDNESGEWYYNNDTASNETRVEMVYILSDKGDTGWGRKKRAAAEEGTSAGDNWHSAAFRVFRCFYENCIPPPPPTLPPGRPLDFHKWSNASAWQELGYTMPVEGSTVFIPPGAWMVIDIDPPPLRMIFVYGGLEVMDDADHTLEVEIVLVQGGKFQVGSQEEPHNHTFTLMLNGDHFTEDQPLPDGPNLGAKALGIFGFADFHGQDVGVAWTKLASTASAGSDTLELQQEVTWAVGNEIVISTTSYELFETEKRTIASVSGTTITLTEPLEFEHLGTEATLSDGTTFQMRAEVGVLTRNVRIVGNNYTELMDQKFGGRVLVGEFEQDDITYTGSARFANVEFAVAGQAGWYDNFDPRYALAFLDTGDSIDSDGQPKKKESYVKKCAFNYVFNTAIGLFGSNNIPVEDNVIFRFTNDGIFDEGTGNRINRNLVTMGESVARILDQSLNDIFYACININRAKETMLYGNVMAGCAQGGLNTIGNPVENNYTISNNEARGCQHGLHMVGYHIKRPSSGKVHMRDFYAWKNWDYGIATQTENSIEFTNMTLVDNGAGLLPFGIGPAADAHLYEDKYISMVESIIVAVSDVYDCSAEDTMPDIYKSKMESGRRWRGRGYWTPAQRKLHHTGVIWPIFQSSFGKQGQPWNKPILGAAGTYAALRGIVYLTDVVFANFGENCGGTDVVFRTNIGADDMNWPIQAEGISFVDVDTDMKVYMDEPILGKINPADCTDFDCDGLKKCIIYDTDGSVKEDGIPGTIIPNSAFEWDGNPVRGLGDYRIPKPMVTELNGDKIEFEDKMPNKGIYRDETCVWNEDWRAWSCNGINHRLMIIESMDRDTKIRRLSPIAMLADAGSNGYIDLVNGLQDFSCCSGYICAERLSTFYTMVVTGLEYEVMFTSIPPQNFRIHMLYNDGGDAVRSKIWFPKQQRLDIYVNGMFMSPNNLDFNSADYNLLPPDDSFIPALSELNGANYFDPNTGHLYLIVKGPEPIEIKTQPIVVLKLGMTVPIENFFEENVVGNLAGLLGIDPSNIRVTNIVREGSVSGRKKRAEGDIIGVEFEVGPPPSQTLFGFIPEPEGTTPDTSGTTVNPAYTIVTEPSNATEATAPPGHLDYEQLSGLTGVLANAFQTGTLNLNIPGAEMTGLSVESPVVPPEAPPPYTSPEERSQVTELTFAEQLALNNSAMLEEYEVKAFDVPEALGVAGDIDDVAEMKVISSEVKIYAKDADGKMIAELGDSSDPWQCTVSVLSGPGGDVMGTTTVDFISGIATFDDIYIDQSGANYVLQFVVSYPTTTITPADSIPFDVSGRPLGLKFTEEVPLVPQNTTFSFSAKIWDDALDQAADSGVLSSFAWDCTASLTNGSLSGTTDISLPTAENEAIFNDLMVEEVGLDFIVDVTCTTTDGNITVNAISHPFHVHDFPTTGLMRQTVTSFSFKGPYGKVQSILDNFQSFPITCEGCPSMDEKPRITADSNDECTSPLVEC